jgi:hypothetical protein
MRRRRFILGLLVCILATAPVAAQWVVFDPTNYASALERLWQLQQQYRQLVDTYRQIRAEYDHMLRMAQVLPVAMASRYKALAPSWRTLVGTDTYGTTTAWLNTANTGDEALAGFTEATQTLRDYGAAFGLLPAETQARIRAHYATAELADATTVLGLQTVGRVRWRGPSLQATVHALEDDSFSSDESMNTEIGVLNKINAAGVLALRTYQSTNQLLVSLLEDRVVEAKRQREADVASIHAEIAFVTQARPFLERASEGTTAAVTAAIIP